MKIDFVKHQKYNGEWFKVAWKKHNFACCDCGLVHTSYFKVVKGILYMKVYSRKDLTESARKKYKHTMIASRYKNEPIRVAWYDKNNKLVFNKILK